MASALSEETFLCSICLHVLCEPVSTACGHNFCLACLTQHWDAGGQCRCPLCKTAFSTRPQLQVNTLLAQICAPFRKSAQLTEQEPVEPVGLCDLCTGAKVRAVRSCLVCEASYCATHWEPHETVPRLKRHGLHEPVVYVEDRVCHKHNRPLEMFCQTDQVCVCQFCREVNHMSHTVVLLDEEYKAKKDQLDKTQAEVLQSIKERREKIEQIKMSVNSCKSTADKDISSGVKAFNAVKNIIENIQAEFIASCQYKMKSVEREAEGFISELDQEIMELSKGRSKLEKVSHTEDHLYFLQNLSSPPQVKNWNKVNVNQPWTYRSSGHRNALALLEKTLEVKMKELLKADL